MHDCFVHAKRPRLLFLVIQFRMESADFPFVVSCAVDLDTAKYACRDTAAEQQTNDKIQHSFITSLSCGVSERRNSPSVSSPPMKFGSVSSVKEIYPCFPKSIGSFVITLPP